MNKTIITIAVCLSFVVNSILVTLSFTRRSADDLVKINTVSQNTLCEKAGGYMDFGGCVLPKK